MKNKDKIVLECKLEPVLENKILVILYKHLMYGAAYLTDAKPPFPSSKKEDKMSEKAVSIDGLILLELTEILNFKFKNWNIVKLHLADMVNKRLIEEGHFPNGIVDYSLEQDGINKAIKLMFL